MIDVLEGDGMRKLVSCCIRQVFILGSCQYTQAGASLHTRVEPSHQSLGHTVPDYNERITSSQKPASHLHPSPSISAVSIRLFLRLALRKVQSYIDHSCAILNSPRAAVSAQVNRQLTPETRHQSSRCAGQGDRNIYITTYQKLCILP